MVMLPCLHPFYYPFPFSPLIFVLHALYLSFLSGLIAIYLFTNVHAARNAVTAVQRLLRLAPRPLDRCTC